MDSLAPYAASKDRVLRAVGLNLVNFQRLEKILKWLAELRPITGSVPEINKQLELRRQSTQRSTLGAIIPLWLETAYGQKPRLANPKTDLDVVIAFWLQLNIPDRWKRLMRPQSTFATTGTTGTRCVFDEIICAFCASCASCGYELKRREDRNMKVNTNVKSGVGARIDDNG